MSKILGELIMEELKKALNALVNADPASTIALKYANDVDDGYSNAGVGVWFSPDWYTSFDQDSIEKPIYIKNLEPAKAIAKFWQDIGDGKLEEIVADVQQREQAVYEGRNSAFDVDTIKQYMAGKDLAELMNASVKGFISGEINQLDTLASAMLHVLWQEFIDEYEPFRRDPEHKKYAGEMLNPWDLVPAGEQYKDLVIFSAISDRLLVDGGVYDGLKIQYDALNKVMNEAGKKVVSLDR